MSFGEQLQEVRRSNGMTQEQFAEALQVSRQAVSRWESGRSYPEVDKILYICNRYGVSIGTLFAEENPLPTAADPSRLRRRPSRPRTACSPRWILSSPTYPPRASGSAWVFWWAWRCWRC